MIARLHWLQLLDRVLPAVIICLLTVILLILIAYIALRVIGLRWLLQRRTVFLEITPPAFTDRSHLATNELFSVLHGLGSFRSWRDRLFYRKTVFALEVVSSKDSGIRYILQVDGREAASFRQTLAAYLPETKIAEVKDYLPADMDKAKVISFKQTGHFAFPLASQEELDAHDPIAYLTGAMTKLESGELMAFQLVLEPTYEPLADQLDSKLLGNEDLLSELRGKQRSLLKVLFKHVNKLLFMATDTAGHLVNGPSRSGAAGRDTYDRMQVARRAKPARQLSVLEQQLAESMHAKIRQPLFKAKVRALVVAKTDTETKQRLKAIRASLAPLSVPKYQSLKARRQWLKRHLNHYYCRFYSLRLPALIDRRACVLAVSEVADLYHFPHSRSAKTENVVKSLSKTLPAPVSLKNGTPLDVILGENRYHGSVTPIGLTADERQRHVYIIGGTGNGKTTMLQYAIVQDMQAGKGLAVIDPHGDLADTMLKYVPKGRIDDVVYFNPDDIGYPFGLNLLELPEGLSEDELTREKDLVTESVISVFRKIFSDEDVGGHRIEYVLRNAIQTALTVPDATLFTVFDLLNDPKYRRSVIKMLDNKDLINFWKHELNKAGEMQRVKMSAGITAKIGRFLFSASAKRILEQPKSTINFDDIINSGKILICNFSKGLLGEDTSELFGITVLAKLQLASLRRARLSQSERRPFYLYVDEFQNFATASFVQMLSESRKYKLFMTMAEQSTSQQKDQQMVSVILANVGTVICFRTGNPHDERLLLPLFSSFVEDGEIANLSPFNFYARLSAVRAQEPLSGQTLLLPDATDETVANKVITQSRKLHAVEKIHEEKPKNDNTKPKATKQKRKQTKPTTKNAHQAVPST